MRLSGGCNYYIIIIITSYKVIIICAGRSGSPYIALTSRLLYYILRRHQNTRIFKCIHIFFFRFIYVVYIQLHFHPRLTDARLRWNKKEQNRLLPHSYYIEFRAFTHDCRRDSFMFSGAVTYYNICIKRKQF